MTKHGIYLGDCMEGMKDMPDNYVDLAIVDPPYGLGSTDFRSALTIRAANKTATKIHIDKKWNDTIPSDDYFKELYRISKNTIIWGCNYFGANIIHPGRIVHYKDLTPFVKNGRHVSDCDLASQSFNRLINYFHYRWSGNVQGAKINWTNQGVDSRIHPTQKPVALYKWLLHNYAKEGDLILDTHMGSGSSYIACLDMGFDYIGYETDADYFKAIEERVYYFTRQTKLFD